MELSKPDPSPYYRKPPMKFNDFKIFYNKDYSLKNILPNKHNYYEFYLLLSGEVTYYIENQEYHLIPGDIILISPQQNHYAYINTNINMPYERYVLWLNPDYLNLLSSPKTNLSFVFQNTAINNAQIRLAPDMFNKIHYLLESILTSSHSQAYGSDLLANAYVTELLINLAQFKLFYSNSYLDMLSLSTSYEDSLIFNILNYINLNICQTITISQICEHFFISKSYLAKLFKEEVGLSVHQYIMKKKLFLAKQDLLHINSMNTLVEKYGFGNYSTFFRAFKLEFGQSPLNYKKHYTNKQ